MKNALIAFPKLLKKFPIDLATDFIKLAIPLNNHAKPSYIALKKLLMPWYIAVPQFLILFAIGTIHL